MRLVRQLRPIIRVRLRTSPDLLAEWNAAARVHWPHRTPAAPTTPPVDEGSGTTATP